MKTTKYFDYVRKRPDRAMIMDEWIEEVIGYIRISPLQKRDVVADS